MVQDPLWVEMGNRMGSNLVRSWANSTSSTTPFPVLSWAISRLSRVLSKCSTIRALSRRCRQVFNGTATVSIKMELHVVHLLNTRRNIDRCSNSSSNSSNRRRLSGRNSSRCRRNKHLPIPSEEKLHHPPLQWNFTRVSARQRLLFISWIKETM